MPKDSKTWKIRTHHCWVRVVALVLVPLHVLSLLPNSVSAAEPTVSNAVVEGKSQAGRAPQQVTVNQTQSHLPRIVPALQFSALPTDEEFSRARVLGVALAPVGGKTTPEENRALADALRACLSDRHQQEKVLGDFLARYPQSPWRASLLAGQAASYRREGNFSKAIAAWQEAWRLGKNDTSLRGRYLADQSVGELAQMLAWAGRAEQLQTLLSDVGARQLRGPSAERLSMSRGSLGSPRVGTEAPFKCGASALAQVLNIHTCEFTPQALTINRATSTTKGMSLSQVAALAREVGANYQMAKRRAGSVVPLPCVVHWKLGHYSALLEEKNGCYLMKDTALAFGHESQQWITSKALDAEASGYFLIPNGPLPNGWRTVLPTEGETVWGRGSTGYGNQDNTTPCDRKLKCLCSPCVGMPSYNIHSSVVSLNIEDTPVGYTPSRGPAVWFTLTYNQREVNGVDTTYGNFGSNWQCNWLTFLTVGTDVKLAVAGGGGRTYTGFDTNTWQYAPQMRDQSVLTKLNLPPTQGDSNACANAYIHQIRYSDGSCDEYGAAYTVGTTYHLFLTKRIDPQGNAVSLTYDNLGRLVSLTDAIGQVTSLSYESFIDATWVTKVTDPFGRTATFQYDGNGQLSQITDMAGMSSQFIYDGTFINSMTTPYGTTHFASGETPIRWLEITDSIGRKERAEVSGGVIWAPPNEQPPPNTEMSWNTGYYTAARNTYYWDHKAMEVYSQGDYSQAKIYHWCHDLDGIMSGILESEKAPLENRIWYAYQNQEWNSGINSGMLECPTQIARSLDAQGTPQLYQYEYNALGRVTKSVDPLGRTTLYTYSSNNLIDLVQVQQVEVNGQTTNYVTLATTSYTTNHLPVMVTDAAGQTSAFSYNEYGQLTSVTNALGQVTTLNYYTTGSSNGRLSSIVGPQSTTLATFTYDNYGRVRTVTDATGYTVTTDYDALDRPTKITYPDGTYEAITYDKLDAVKYRDRLGRVTQTTYNAVRQVINITDPLQRITTFSWCSCNALDAITDANGNVTHWERDIRGRVTRKVYPDSTATVYAYDSATGKLNQMTDAKGQVTAYQYNWDNSIHQVSYSNAVVATPSVVFSYDPNYSRLLNMVDGTGTNSYTYNAINGQLGAGRLASVTGPLSNSAISYAYDALGRAINRSISNVTATVGYDDLGRVNAITNALGGFSYSYTTTTQLSSVTYPNSQSTTFSYYGNDHDQRLQTINHLQPNGTTVISRFDYEYNADGQITKWTQQADAATPTAYSFAYDTANQLLNATLQNTSSGAILKQYGYAYDPAGNRTSEQVDSQISGATPNNLNQLTTRNGTGQMRFWGVVDKPAVVTVGGQPAPITEGSNFSGFATVSAGTNLVPVIAVTTNGTGQATTNTYRVVVTATGAETLLYDLNGNLTSKSNATSVVTYEWDAVNRLVAINETSTNRTEFTYDGLSRRVRIVEKTNGNVISDKRFLWEGTQIAEERDSTGGTVNKRFFAQGAQISGTAYYYTRDHLGSIREMTDSTGTNIVARFDYDPYGRRTLVSGTDLADFGFTGHYYHQASGLHLTLYRAYDANLGRWLSRDPIGEKGGLNLYAYVGDDPVNNIDPFGLWKYYGNWGGPDWTGGQTKPYEDLTPEEQKKLKPPIDAQDECYKQHDLCYSRCRVDTGTTSKDKPCKKQLDAFDTCRKQCDLRLSACLNKINNTKPALGQSVPGQNWHSRRAAGVFSFKGTEIVGPLGWF